MFLLHFSALQREFTIKKFFQEKLSCFDISNIQGSDSVASMVVFVDGKPKKSEYKKFIIKDVEGPDDFAKYAGSNSQTIHSSS